MAEIPTRPTPAPWTLGYYGPTDEWIRDANGEAIMMIGANDTRNPQNAALIVAACNACQQINPQNPHHVAEHIADLPLAIKDALQQIESLGADLSHLTFDSTFLRAALASIETQETP